MAALPFQFTAPRRKALSSVWRTATCVTLAITGLMAAAMTWSPVPAAAACAAASTSSATCQSAATSANTSFADLADDIAAYGIPRVTHRQTPAAARVMKKAVHVAEYTTASGTHFAAATGGLPCQESAMFVANISQWAVPPGCYGNIYNPDRSVYHAPGNFGYCNWWVLALHPTQQDILYGKEYTHSGAPVPGAAVWFSPNVQGASSEGHWAEAVAVSPGGYWVLITEMNFSWRGGGWGRVDFRYIHVGAGVTFIY